MLLALAVAVVWAAWAVLPPRSLAEWTTTTRRPHGLTLTADRKRIFGQFWREVDSGMQSKTEYGPIRLWDLVGGREAADLSEPKLKVYGAADSHTGPDGSWLLVGHFSPMDGTQTWRLWDLATDGERGRLPTGGPGNLPGVDLSGPVASPSGEFIAYSRRTPGNLQAVVQQTKTGEACHILDDAWPLTFSAEDSIFVTGGHAQKKPTLRWLRTFHLQPDGRSRSSRTRDFKRFPSGTRQPGGSSNNSRPNSGTPLRRR